MLRAYSVLAVGVFLVFCYVGQADDSSRVTRSVWDLGTLAKGKAYPSAISARNASCEGRHAFTIAAQSMPWLTITGPLVLERVALGQTKATDVLIDLRNVMPGEYRGEVTIRCTSCPPQCTQDVSELEVRLTVVDGSAEPPMRAVDVPAPAAGSPVPGRTTHDGQAEAVRAPGSLAASVPVVLPAEPPPSLTKWAYHCVKEDGTAKAGTCCTGFLCGLRTGVETCRRVMDDCVFFRDIVRVPITRVSAGW